MPQDPIPGAAGYAAAADLPKPNPVPATFATEVRTRPAWSRRATCDIFRFFPAFAPAMQARERLAADDAQSARFACRRPLR
jgi:hypothetical protein